jgi:hypothetical protein
MNQKSQEVLSNPNQEAVQLSHVSQPSRAAEEAAPEADHMAALQESHSPQHMSTEQDNIPIGVLLKNLRNLDPALELPPPRPIKKRLAWILAFLIFSLVTAGIILGFGFDLLRTGSSISSTTTSAAVSSPTSSTSVFNCANNPYPTKYPAITNNPIPSILKCAIPGVFALTFDDGVSPALNPALLSLLASQNVIATFFINGQNYNDLCSSVSSGILRQIFNAGHQIASHSWGHLRMSTLSNLDLYAQMRLNDVAINYIIGVAPIYFRFPFLDQSDNALSAIASWGYKSVNRNIQNLYTN